MNKNSSLLFMNGPKLFADVYGLKDLPEMVPTKGNKENLAKFITLSREYWLSESKSIKKQYFTTIDVNDVDMGEYKKVVDARNEVIDLANSSRISKQVGETCLGFLDHFLAFRILEDSDGKEFPQYSSCDFVKFNGEFYVTKDGLIDTIQSVTLFHERIQQNLRSETDNLH